MLYLDIFNREYVERLPKTGIIFPSDLNYLRRLYQFNKDSIQNYYLTRNFAVKNTNILSRLVEHFPFYGNYDSYRYLEYSNDKTKYLAKHFKFTSEIEKGVVHPSYFFGNSGEEIIISNYELFNVKEVEQDWKKNKCISVLTHNRNDIKLLLPLGGDDGSRPGLDSVLINVPKLALKYREFLKEQIVAGPTDEGISLSKNHFVIKYVLPTMLEDIIDHVFLNKIMDRFYNREEVTPKYKHRFRIFEPKIQIERYVDNTLDVITNKKVDFINLLRNIHLMFNENAAKLLALEDISLTRQVKWAIVASRIDYMIFLCDISNAKDMNRHYINDFKRLAKRMERDNSFMNMFSRGTELDFKEKLYKISNF